MATHTTADVLSLTDSCRFAALAVLSPKGHPHVTRVAFARKGHDILMFMSDLSPHVRHIDHDPRASLLIQPTVDDPGKTLQSPRVTLFGKVEKHERSEELEQFWLSEHPEASVWISFSDFSFYRMPISKARLIEGFGSMSNIVFP